MKMRLIVALFASISAYSTYAITLDIPSYPEESIIPDDYTFSSGGNCSGANVSPQLVWSDVPDGTQSLAVVFLDLNFNWLHWMLYDIDPNVRHIPENNPNNVGTDGQSSFGSIGYGGPCPPSPNPGNYVFTIHALDTTFGSQQPTRAAINAATIESASYLAYRDINDSQERYEYIAQYKMTFHAEWSEASHPENYPGNAHFSPLVGATHNRNVSIWNEAGLSSSSMEQMAESGSTSLLRNDIDGSINSGSGESRLTGAGIDAVDQTEVFFEVSDSHPLFTMVTMIAPSPDWFIGVNDLDLRENGIWRENYSVDLFAFDAGTDSGVTYTSPNSNTNPQDPIQRIITSPFNNNNRLGRFEFELLNSEGQPSFDDQIFNSGFELN